jgi:hypothetical protein
LFFSPDWQDATVNKVYSSFTLLKDFVSPAEEESILKEVEPHLKRQVYEKDHWDEVWKWIGIQKPVETYLNYIW